MSNNNKEKLKPRVIVKIVVLLVIIIGVLITPFIYSGTTYIKAWNNNKITPFAPTVTESDSGGEATTTDKISGLKLDNVQRINHTEFNKFDLTFEATNYDDRDAKKVEFKIILKKNDNTPSGLTTISSGSTNMVQTGICLCANWIGFESYQTSLSTFNDSYLTNGTARTTSIKCETTFPAKADTWPVKVTVDSPNCYLYIYYRTQENGEYVDNSYILEYTYSDIMTSSTTGGIIK